MKTKEQIIDDINNYIFGTAKLGEEYTTEEMRDIVADTWLGIRELTKEYEEKNGGKSIDVNDSLFDEYDAKSDDIVMKGAEKIYTKMINGYIGALCTFNADPYIIENEEQAIEIIDFIAKCTFHDILTPADECDFEDACSQLDLTTEQTSEIHYYCVNDITSVDDRFLTICFNWKKL